MIAIHEPGTGKLAGHYDPQTGEVRDPQGRLLFCYLAALRAIEVTRKGHTSTIPLPALVAIGLEGREYK